MNCRKWKSKLSNFRPSLFIKVGFQNITQSKSHLKFYFLFCWCGNLKRGLKCDFKTLFKKRRALNNIFKTQSNRHYYWRIFNRFISGILSQIVWCSEKEGIDSNWVAKKLVFGNPPLLAKLWAGLLIFFIDSKVSLTSAPI